MPPYNPTSVYVPSPSETDKEARDMSIKRNLTVTNVSAQTLGVLGDLTSSGTLTATKYALTDGVTLAAPLDTTSVLPVALTSGVTRLPATTATVGGLITIDQTEGIMFFSKISNAREAGAQQAYDEVPNTTTAAGDTIPEGTDQLAAETAINLLTKNVVQYQDNFDTGFNAVLAAISAFVPGTGTTVNAVNELALQTKNDQAAIISTTFEWVKVT